MSILDAPEDVPPTTDIDLRERRSESTLTEVVPPHERADGPDEPVTDETPPETERRADEAEERETAVRVPVLPKAFRVRGVRIGSVAKIGSIFFLLGYGVFVGTCVLVWTAVVRFGLVTDAENLVETSLGLSEVTVSGQDLFDVVALGAAAVFVVGFLTMLALALVYNTACAVFGGITLETAPAKKRLITRLRERIARSD